MTTIRNERRQKIPEYRCENCGYPDTSSILTNQRCPFCWNVTTNSRDDIEKGFHNVLSEHPNDATPHLQYADWLEEKGRNLEAAGYRKMITRGSKILGYRERAKAAGNNEDKLYHAAAHMHLQEAKIPERVRSIIRDQVKFAEHPYEEGGPAVFGDRDELAHIHHRIFDAEERYTK